MNTDNNGGRVDGLKSGTTRKVVVEMWDNESSGIR